MEQASNKKKVIGILAGALAFGLSYFGVQQLFDSPVSFDKVMMHAASELNESCPIMVDQETRLDNAVAMPNNILQYNYTLITTDKETVDLDAMNRHLESTLINVVKTNPDLKLYRDNKATLAYSYKDMNGKFLTKILVTPEKYSN